MGLLNPVSLVLALLGRFIEATSPNALPHPDRFGRQGAEVPRLSRTHD
jgi:hypothetical protein